MNLIVPISFFLSLTICIIASLVDFAGGIASIILLSVCNLYAIIGSRNDYLDRFKLCAILCFCYLVSAIISSSCFSETEFFMASDPMRYITMANNTHSYRGIMDDLHDTYFNLIDNNGLYNSMLNCIGIMCNKAGEKASSFVLTLPQTLFGILSIQTLFRVLQKYFTSQKSVKYSLSFAFLSIAFFYSGIIVRDIILLFIFTVGLEVITGKFNAKGVVLLIFLFFFACGIRLFSGFFFLSFIGLYFFFGLRKTPFRYIMYLILTAILFVVLSSAFFKEQWQKTQKEVLGYTEWQQEESSQQGLSGKLRKLPPVIEQVSLFLYSQSNPFPPYSCFLHIHTLSPAQIYISAQMMISAIWWTVISYSLIIFLLYKQGYKSLSINNRLLYLLALLLIFVSTTMHVDIRRLLPVYPIIYLLYLQYAHILKPKCFVHEVRSCIVIGYIGLNIAYIIIK